MKSGALFLIVLLASLSAACSGGDKKYQYAFETAGGPEGWPILIQDLSINNQKPLLGGLHGSGFNREPPKGTGTIFLGPSKAPRSVQATWFSYRTQTYYRIDLMLPEDVPEQVEAWYDAYPVSEYQHYLVLAFSGKGEAKVWWRAWCKPCDLNDDSQDFSTPIVESAQGQTYEAEVTGHKAQTKALVERGVIPSPWK